MSVTKQLRPVPLDGSDELLRIARRGYHVEPALLEHVRQPGPQQRLVLADHDSHGNSASRWVP